jgi:hypothetical protein
MTIKGVATALFVVMCTAGAVAQQSPPVTVKSTLAKGVDVTKFKTYKWFEGQGAFDADLNKQIIAAIDKELGTLGLTKTTATPDVLVTYHSLQSTRVDLKTWEAQGTGGAWKQYPVGTLVVNLLDPKSPQVQLWSARTDQPMVLERAQYMDTVNRFVSTIFQQWPTRLPQKK